MGVMLIKSPLSKLMMKKLIISLANHFVIYRVMRLWSVVSCIMEGAYVMVKI